MAPYSIVTIWYDSEQLFDVASKQPATTSYIGFQIIEAYQTGTNQRNRCIAVLL